MGPVRDWVFVRQGSASSRFNSPNTRCLHGERTTVTNYRESQVRGGRISFSYIVIEANPTQENVSASLST